MRVPIMRALSGQSGMPSRGRRDAAPACRLYAGAHELCAMLTRASSQQTKSGCLCNCEPPPPARPPAPNNTDMPKLGPLPVHLNAAGMLELVPLLVHLTAAGMPKLGPLPGHTSLGSDCRSCGT
eukprot:354463-Chlamydomonas_euryale.AAC.12